MAAKWKNKKSQQGFASIEAIAMLFILATMVSFSFGTFGAIHTGILNSISARAYLWEILDSRSTPTYLRSNLPDPASYGQIGFRASGISSRFPLSPPRHRSSGRNIDIRKRASESDAGNQAAHDRIYQMDLSKRASIDVENVWVKAQYGICLDATCGGLQ